MKRKPKAEQPSSIKQRQTAPGRRGGETESARLLRVDNRPSPRRVELLLRHWIEHHRPGLGTKVRIVFTRNASTMISRSERAGRITLRLHCLFQRAPEDILADVVRYFFSRKATVDTRKVRTRLIDFVAEHRESTLLPYPARRKMPPRGECYDLDELRDRQLEEYFPDIEAPPEMGWTHRCHRSLMGKWVEVPDPNRNLILINRLLDNSHVPSYYVDYVIYHELLHELTPIVRSRGRWIHHPPEFKRREKRYPLYKLAQQWERECLSVFYERVERQKNTRRR